MPDEYDEVAERIWNRMDKRFDERFDGCTSEACRKAKAEAMEVFNKTVTEGDTQTLGELKRLNQNLDRVFEEIEKVQNAEVEEIPCPNCEFNGTEKPPAVGKCPEGCTKFSAHDKKHGYNNCPICGEEIEWD